MNKIKIDVEFSPCGHRATVEVTIPYLAEGCTIINKKDLVIRPQNECPVCNCKINPSMLAFSSINVKKE